MVRMGVDPGAWVSAVAVVRVEREEAEILHAEMVPNELLSSRVADLVEAHGVEEAVIERPSKGPWKRGVSKEHLKVLKAVGDEVEKVLEERGGEREAPPPLEGRRLVRGGKPRVAAEAHGAPPSLGGGRASGPEGARPQEGPQRAGPQDQAPGGRGGDDPGVKGWA